MMYVLRCEIFTTFAIASSIHNTRNIIIIIIISSIQAKILASFFVQMSMQNNFAAMPMMMSTSNKTTFAFNIPFHHRYLHLLYPTPSKCSALHKNSEQWQEEAAFQNKIQQSLLHCQSDLVTQKSFLSIHFFVSRKNRFFL